MPRTRFLIAFLLVVIAWRLVAFSGSDAVLGADSPAPAPRHHIFV